MKCTMCWKGIEKISLVEGPLGDTMEAQLCPTCAEAAHGRNYLGQAEKGEGSSSCAVCGDTHETTKVPSDGGSFWLCMDCLHKVMDSFQESASEHQSPLTVNEFIRLLKAGLTFTQIVFLKQEGIL